MIVLKATHIAQKRIVESDKRNISGEEKSNRVADVLKLILPSNAVLHLAFPIHRYIESFVLT